MNSIELANDSGLTYYGMGKDRARFIHHLEAFAALVAAQEREECSKVCIQMANRCDDIRKAALEAAAEAIRARGTT